MSELVRRFIRSGLDGSSRTLVFAAMDTTSNALARILHLLAEHPEVQDKMRAEVLDASETEEIPYDQLVGLPLLDAVCRETLRLYVAPRSCKCSY